MARPQYEYIKFKINSDARFQQLVTIFERLKEDTNEDRIQEPDDYLPYFDDTARSYFWWPTDEELKAYAEEWLATPLETRWNDPKFMRWDFGSMIESIHNGEYILVSCRAEDQANGILEFDCLAWPYGGTGSLEALVESFGFALTEIFNGAQPPYTLPDTRPKTKPGDIL